MSQAIVVPSKIIALFERVIEAESVSRNDWHDICAPLCIVVEGKKVEHKTMKQAFSAMFTVKHMAKNAPGVVEGTELYAIAKKAAQGVFSLCANRALVALGHREKKAPRGSNTGTGGESGTSDANKESNASLPQFNAGAMALQHEIADRAKRLRETLVQFQTMHKLNKKAIEAIGFIAESAGTLEAKAIELGEAMLGKSSEEKDGALQQALKAALAPKPASEPAELETTSIEETGITVETEATAEV